MGLNLSSFFHYDKSNRMAENSGQTSQTTSSEGTSFRVADELRNLKPGQILSGEVVAIRNGEVDIALSKDLIMAARLDRDIMIALGQTMTFEVKSISESQVSLSPLFENMGQNPNILNAINAAHIPLNNKSIAMVSTMMEEGMSVDKESLQNIYKQIVNNPEASGNAIIQMNRMQIPVTLHNIAQFENYKNYEHSILNAVDEVADHLLTEYGEILQRGEPAEITDFFQKIISIFGGEEATGVSLKNGETEKSSAQGVKNIPDGLAETMSHERNQGEEAVNEKAEESTETVSAFNTHLGKEGLDGRDSIKTADINLLLGLSSKDSINLAHLMKVAGVLPDTAALAQAGQSTPEEVLKIILELFQKSEPADRSSLLESLSSREFMNLLKGQVTKQWMIQPEEIAQDGKVEELYKRIQEQTTKLAESMEGLAKESSPLTKSINNLSGNVEFMNQLNQLYTYVQLPLKMSRENAHGELYVYTNKKNLAKKEGSVSALLHLDMENLGTIDIHVTMQNKKVSTKFYLEKEKYIDFIAEHIHILNERLEKRGYSMSTEVLLKEQKTNVMEEMINKEKGTALTSKLSFDVRA